MKRHHRGPIPPKGQRTIDRARELYAAGRTVEEVAQALGVCRSSALDYRSRVQRETGAVGRHRHCKYDHPGPGCPRCGLRGEHICLPPSAVDYLGTRGDGGTVVHLAHASRIQ